MLRRTSVNIAPVILGLAMAASLSAARMSAAQPYYPTVAVKLPEPPSDASFAVFRGELAAIAKRRVYAELARLVVAYGFFWKRDFSTTFDPGKTGVENLAVAIGLERGDGLGWTTLATFAGEATAAPLATVPGIICAPARPQFDEPEYLMLLRKTATGPADWSYPRHASATMRATANAGAAVVETLGLHFIRLRGARESPASRFWTQVAAPSGKTGFIASAALTSLVAERLCYVKDITGRWRIAGYIGGGE
jgi:hypothetical protein